jgi:glycosyltransferase involved in cell wall biosynthesis
MSRKLAESLVKAGVQASVILPRRKGQRPLEWIEGVEVRSFPALALRGAMELIRESPADIFHSQDPTLLTYLAQHIHPRRIHLITCRDPRDTYDWLQEFRYATARRRVMTPMHYLTESGPVVARAIRRAHGVFCPAQFLRDKVQKMYRLPARPGFLPNLIEVPDSVPQKSETPTFAFLARWDKRKRPETFLDLARRFPSYHFVAMGQGSAAAEGEYDRALRARYQGIPNLEITGFINRFEQPQRVSGILSRSWGLISTAVREGLPLSFLEAAAQGCAILSGVDPDGVATRFGIHVKSGDFAAALPDFVSLCPRKSAEAHGWVSNVYATPRALAAHLDVYRAFGCPGNERRA